MQHLHDLYVSAASVVIFAQSCYHIKMVQGSFHAEVPPGKSVALTKQKIVLASLKQGWLQ